MIGGIIKFMSFGACLYNIIPLGGILTILKLSLKIKGKKL
jgi:hypothetical protein